MTKCIEKRAPREPTLSRRGAVTPGSPTLCRFPFARVCLLLLPPARFPASPGCQVGPSSLLSAERPGPCVLNAWAARAQPVCECAQLEELPL